MIQLLHDYYGVDERWRFNDTRALRRRARRRESPSTWSTAAARIDAAGVPRRGRGGDARVSASLLQAGHLLHRARALGAGLERGRGEESIGPLGGQPAHSPGPALRLPDRGRADKTLFIGRLGPDEENQRFMKALGKRPGTNAALFPIAVRGRVVNLIYGDNGAAGQVKPDLGELIVLVQKVPRAYLRIIRKRIAETRKSVGESQAGRRKEDHDRESERDPSPSEAQGRSAEGQEAGRHRGGQEAGQEVGEAGDRSVPAEPGRGSKAASAREGMRCVGS